MCQRVSSFWDSYITITYLPVLIDVLPRGRKKEKHVETNIQTSNAISGESPNGTPRLIMLQNSNELLAGSNSEAIQHITLKLIMG